MKVEYLKKILPWAILALAILCGAVIRLRLLGIPLERDEGEYAYMAQLILKGIPPYLVAYSMKLPGIYFSYAAMMALFGQTAAGIHLGLIVINAVTTIAVYFMARRLFGHTVGIFAGAIFSVLSLGRSVLGLSANAEQFVILFTVPGFLLLLKALDSGRRASYLASGILLGMAFIVKQHSVFFVACALFYILAYRLQARRKILEEGLSLFILGALAPFGIACAILAATGAFTKFWFWTFVYAREYASRVTIPLALSYFIERFGFAAASALPIWLAAAFGLIVLRRREADNSAKAFVLLFVIFSFLAVMPGFIFRDHYFILVLPAISILAGLALTDAFSAAWSARSYLSLLKPAALIALSAIIFAYPFVKDRAVFFASGVNQASRTIYGSNPFPEAVEIAKHLNGIMAKDDRVVVFGSEPEIYFYTKKTAPTGYIYMYPLMESQPYSSRMQEEMKSEVERAAPEYLVFVNLSISWTEWSILDGERKFFEWFDRYYKKYYEMIGVVNILSRERTEYIWGDAAKTYSPKTPFLIYIFKRNPA